MMETQMRIIRAVGLTEDNIRELIHTADCAGLPMAGRTIHLPAYVCDVFGCKVVFEHGLSQVELRVKKKPAYSVVTL